MGNDLGQHEDLGRHEFQTVSTETVYHGTILALRRDQVVMPGGHTAEREVVEHHAAVAIVALDEAQRLVLVRQYRHPVRRRLLELPAGLLDIAGEDPLTAARRELAEETALGADDWSVLADLASSPGFTDEAVRIFLARGLHPAARPEPEFEEADLQIVRLSLDEAVRAVLAGHIVNATAVAGILAWATAQARGETLRPADAPWPDKPETLLRRGAVPGAPSR